MRRYEEHKRFVIADAMVDFIVGRLSRKVTDHYRAESIDVVLNEASGPRRTDILKQRDLTIEFAREPPMAVEQEQLFELDRLIAMKARDEGVRSWRACSAPTSTSRIANCTPSASRYRSR